MNDEELKKWLASKVEGGYITEESAKQWIQGAIKKKGSLRKSLGVKEGKTISKSLLKRIANAKVGTKIKSGGKTVTVTAKLKRRARLALTLGGMKKRTTSETVEWLLTRKGVDKNGENR